MKRRNLIAAVCFLMIAGGLTAPSYAKHHKGEVPEVEQHQHRQRGKSVAKPQAKRADDAANHDAKDDKGKGGKGKDDAAGHH